MKSKVNYFSGKGVEDYITETNLLIDEIVEWMKRPLVQELFRQYNNYYNKFQEARESKAPIARITGADMLWPILKFDPVRERNLIKEYHEIALTDYHKAKAKLQGRKSHLSKIMVLDVELEIYTDVLKRCAHATHISIEKNKRPDKYTYARK